MKKNMLILIVLILFMPLLATAGGKKDDNENYAGDDLTSSSIECKYKVTFPKDISKPDGDKYVDYIYLSFEPGKGYIGSMRVESVTGYFKSDNVYATSDGIIFKDKPLYLGHMDEFKFIFNSETKSCPSDLSYFALASSGKAVSTGGFVLGNYNYSGDIMLQKLGTITLVSSKDLGTQQTPENDKNNKRKNCGKAYVINPSGGNVASDYDGYSFKVQYYMENSKKYIEISRKKGKEEIEKKSFELNQTTGSYLDLDYYKNTYGLKTLRIETFDKCEKATIVTCTSLVNDAIYIGKTCNESASGDPDTQVTPETITEYEEHSLGSTFVSPDIDKLDCTSLLGDPTKTGSPAYYLSVIFKVLKYVAIVLLIVITSLDFVQAVAAHDDDAIKKAFNKAIMRLILCIIIFVLPTLVEFMLKFIHTRAITTCGI